MSPALILDGTVLRAFQFLPVSEQRQVAQAVGSDRLQLLRSIDALLAGLAFC